MGLLDDAIREHLDLKRRRGADPAEIERAEREALGPVSRGEVSDVGVEDAEREGLPYDVQAEDDWGEEPFADEQFEDDLPPDDAARGRVAEPMPFVPERAGQRQEPAIPYDDEDDDDFFDDEPLPPEREEGPEDVAPPRRGPRSSDLPHAGEETVEYRMPAGDDEEELDEDVLEETPEFLQDTPDHDRLWFEQRPPRDFDFDK